MSVVEVEIPICECSLCRYVWAGTKPMPEIPKSCPRCRTTRWETGRRLRKRRANAKVLPPGPRSKRLRAYLEAKGYRFGAN